MSDADSRLKQRNGAVLSSEGRCRMEAMELEQGPVEACIAACGNCSRVCLHHVRHCLEMGGEHADAAHIAMLLTCANVCRTAAELMTIDSEWYPTMCELCAQVCEECAEACAAMDDMEDCVAACRQCAQSCRLMVAEMVTDESHLAEGHESTTETVN